MRSSFPIPSFGVVLFASQLLTAPSAGFGADDAAGSVEAKPGMQAVLDLATQYDDRRDTYWAALGVAETDEDRSKAGELNPDDEFVPRFLALEEQHRGTDAGLTLLRFVVSNAARYADPEAVASLARVTACERLEIHYVDHPDTDACLKRLNRGVWTPQAEMLLRQLAEDSPHNHVRAAAWYYLAKWLVQKAELPRIREKMRARLERAPDGDKGWRLRLLESMELFGDIDSEQLRDEAIAAAKQVQEHFPDERHPNRQFSGPAKILLTRDDTGPQQDTFGEKAEHLIFQIQHLVIGATAPEITGVDADGETFRLSDYRGRVVVLMFSANWCGPCKGMYLNNRKLVEKLEDEPFAFLGVMADQAIDTVQQAHKDGEITWRVWWDGDHGPIQTKWNINAWPTIYVVDHRGVIRYRQLRGEELDSAVLQLIEARADDPDANALLDAHPIPEILTLERAK